MRYSVENEIERPIEVVFAFLSDLRNELVWNPAARSVQMVGDGPIGSGTQFRAEWRNAPSTVVTLSQYASPTRWATRSRSLGMDVEFVGELEPLGGATRYVATVSVRANGLAVLLLPFAVWAMRHQEAGHRARIKAALESPSADAALRVSERTGGTDR